MLMLKTENRDLMKNHGYKGKLSSNIQTKLKQNRNLKNIINDVI